MGAFLEKPITEKHTESYDAKNMRIALSSVQGWRTSMEDAHVVETAVEGDPNYTWLGVFDGHGGTLISQSASQRILGKILSTSEWKTDHVTPANIGEAIRKAFISLDEEMRDIPEIQAGADISGSTAITAMVTDRHIICGNAGDSRCILVRKDAAVAMSDDHKPYNEIESARIHKAGGTVALKRVNGDLAVSRAFGDYLYKANRHMKAEEQQVSVEPEIRVVERTSEDQFLILACDGIWDVFENDEMARWIVNLAQSGECGDNLVEMANKLIDVCLHERDSRDNMSVIIVAFPGAKFGERPPAAAVEAAAEIQPQTAA